VSSATAVPPGARLFDGDREVGDVRSSVVSPRRGAIALAMVRREVPVGTTVAWRVAETAGAEAAGDAVITALPAGG
jgi:glycine cleavage system aminomethyltransferase T